LGNRGNKVGARIRLVFDGEGRRRDLEVMAARGIGRYRGKSTRSRMEREREKQRELGFVGKDTSRNVERKKVAFKEDEIEVEEEHRLSLMDVN